MRHDTANTGEPELPGERSASTTKSSWSQSFESSWSYVETTFPTLFARRTPSGKPRTSTTFRSRSAALRPIFQGTTGSAPFARRIETSSWGSVTRRVSGTSSRSYVSSSLSTMRSVDDTRRQPTGTSSTACSSSVTAGHSET